MRLFYALDVINLCLCCVQQPRDYQPAGVLEPKKPPPRPPPPVRPPPPMEKTVSKGGCAIHTLEEFKTRMGVSYWL